MLPLTTEIITRDGFHMTVDTFMLGSREDMLAGSIRTIVYLTGDPATRCPFDSRPASSIALGWPECWALTYDDILSASAGHWSVVRDLRETDYAGCEDEPPTEEWT